MGRELGTHQLGSAAIGGAKFTRSPAALKRADMICAEGVSGFEDLDLAPETRAELARLCTMRHYAAGETIFWEDDAADQVVRLKSGSAKCYKLLPNGRSQIARFAVDGDFLGQASFESYTYTAETLTPAIVRMYPRRRFDALADQDPGLRRAVAAVIAQELHQSQRQVLLLGRMPAAERVSQFLLDYAERLPGSGRPHAPRLLELPMTRADIADYLGLTIETVSRTMSRFRRDGLIELPRPNVVKFTDPVRLCQEAAAMAA